jgi:hypothetical protein
MTQNVSSSPRSNSTITAGQICFGTIDFLPHPPTLFLALKNFNREIDLEASAFVSGPRARFASQIQSIRVHRQKIRISGNINAFHRLLQ